MRAIKIFHRVTVGTIRSNAYRAGHPVPIILDVRHRALPSGGFILDQDSLKLLAAE
jgi:hypothetical protein